ncbi:MAG: MFS transporter [Bryobacterales bacterium]|nr:MFS transporter [Bryobacteraceae bacterium]MDW8355995.1 MFS transporter [Bryobacterales bacterium]
MASNPQLAEVSPAVASRAETGLATLVLLSGAHFVIDLYSSALGALQPLLNEKLRLSLTQAGILGGVFVFSSSVLQPVYGWLSDRFPTRLFTVLAPAVAGLFLSALGLAPSYAWLLLLVLAGGAGIAAFHPQASALAAATSAHGRGRAMAVFVSAGTLGLSLGPAYFTRMATELGLARSWWAALPGVLLSALLAVFLRGSHQVPCGRRRSFDGRPLAAVWRPLALLYALVFIRSIVQITYAQLLPLYLKLERGFSLAAANYALTLYLASGALGGFLGGHLADRFGARGVIQVSMIGSAPLLLLFFFADGLLALAGLALGGFVLLFTIPVNVVMAQELAPAQAGTVSALMMGFAWGTAGLIFVPLVGWCSDQWSLHDTLAGLLAFPVLGFFLARRLPG